MIKKHDATTKIRANSFYFDNGVFNFLIRPLDEEEKRDAEWLIDTIGRETGINLFEDGQTGFRQISAPGLYLEQTGEGTGMLTDL